MFLILELHYSPFLSLFVSEPVLPMVELEATAMNSLMSSLCVSALPQHTLRHRAPNVLPTYSNSADDMDNLDDVRMQQKLCSYQSAEYH